MNLFKQIHCAGAVAICISLTGCAAVESLKINSEEEVARRIEAGVPHGVIYHLPARAIITTANYTLEACPNMTDAEMMGLIGRVNAFKAIPSSQDIDKANRDNKTAELRQRLKSANEGIDQLTKEIEKKLSDIAKRPLTVKVKDISITGETTYDYTAGAFTIDTRELSNFFKEVPEAKIEIKNMLLKSVTYDAKDKTRDAISGLGKLAFRVAAMGANVAAPGIGGIVALADMQKSNEVSSALNAGAPENMIANILQGRLQDLVDNIRRTRSKLEICNGTTIDNIQKRNTLSASAKNLEPPLAAAQHAYDKVTEPNSGSTTDQIEAAEKILTKAKKARQDVLDKRAKLIAAELTASIRDDYLPLDCKLTHTVSPTTSLLEKWFNTDKINQAPIPRSVGDPCADTSAQAGLQGALSLIQLSVTPLQRTVKKGGKMLSVPDVPNISSVKGFDGIYYRVPRPATIRLRKLFNSNAVLAGQPPDYRDTPYFERAMFHQFGLLGAIEVHNGIFQSNKYVINFTEDGLLSSFQYIERSARASEAIGTANDLLDEKDDAAVNAIDRETKLLDAEKKRLEAIKGVKDAEKALTDTEN